MESESESDYCSSSTSSSMSSTEDELHEKVDSFEDIIQGYSESDFKKNLRLDRSTANILIGKKRCITLRVPLMLTFNLSCSNFRSLRTI